MEKRRWKFFVVSTLIVVTGLATGCDDDYNSDDNSNPMQRVYALAQLDASGVSGTVTFRKQSSTATLITIQLTGTVTGDSHPAHIHANTAANGGPIAVDFNPVSGANGKSETVVTELNDGTPVTYEQLVDFDGHVNIHKSVAEIAVMIAQGNIGSNATPISVTDPY
jgi:hypothetical protein